MCVIAICEQDKTRPTEDVLEAMWDSNNDGAGIAWQERKGVKYKKGLSFEEVRDLALTVPAPFVVHFRISSVGPTISKLTHPFPVTADVSLDLSGTVEKVLFHNGTWSEWQKEGRQAVFNAGAKLPFGRWSDTRMMALLAHHYGDGVLDLIGEKVVTLGSGGPKDIQLYGRGWSLWQKDGMNLLVSNTFWEARYNTLKRAKEAFNTPLIAEVIPNEASRALTLVPQQEQQTQAEAQGERPFKQPLSFFEARHAAGHISQQGIERIRAAFARQIAMGLLNSADLTTSTVQ